MITAWTSIVEIVSHAPLGAMRHSSHTTGRKSRHNDGNKKNCKPSTSCPWPPYIALQPAENNTLIVSPGVSACVVVMTDLGVTAKRYLSRVRRRCGAHVLCAYVMLLLRSTGDAAKLIWSIESRLREGSPDFSHVTADGQLQRRPEMGLVHPNRNTCSLFSHSRCVYSHLGSHLWRSKLFKILYAWYHVYKVFWTGMIAIRPARPSLSWPSHRLYNLARYSMCSCSSQDCYYHYYYFYVLCCVILRYVILCYVLLLPTCYVMLCCYVISDCFVVTKNSSAPCSWA